MTQRALAVLLFAALLFPPVAILARRALGPDPVVAGWTERDPELLHHWLRGGTEIRGQIAAALVESGTLVGESAAGVRALLGEPDRVAESGAFAYDLSVGAVLPDPADLLVRFEGGAVVAASVEPR